MNGNKLLATLKVGNAVRIPEWYSEVESCIDSRWLNEKRGKFLSIVEIYNSSFAIDGWWFGPVEWHKDKDHLDFLRCGTPGCLAVRCPSIDWKE